MKRRKLKNNEIFINTKRKVVNLDELIDGVVFFVAMTSLMAFSYFGLLIAYGLGVK